MLKVIKKSLKYPCYICKSSINGKTIKQKHCKACKGTGKYKDEIYYFIVTDKNGQQYAYDGDSLK